MGTVLFSLNSQQRAVRKLRKNRTVPYLKTYAFLDEKLGLRRKEFDERSYFARLADYVLLTQGILF
jgi:hypothetical protein